MARAIAEGAGTLFIAAAPVHAEESHVNVSLSAGVYRPWRGDTGHSAILSAQYGRKADHFWIGIEVEHRRFDANLGSGYRPQYDSVLFRGLFHYHFFPASSFTPYVGLGTGIGLHVVDRKGRVNGEWRRFRHSVGGGTTFLALAGLQAQIPGTRHFSLYAEARFESASDLWEKRGADWRNDQVGGVMGSLGLRMRF